MLDSIVDRNWSDQDAVDCLMLSDFPSAEQFNTGGYKPASQQDPFPFKAFALPAFAEDVKARLSAIGFDMNEAEDNWQLAGPDPDEVLEPVDDRCSCLGTHDAACVIGIEERDGEQ